MLEPEEVDLDESSFDDEGEDDTHFRGRRSPADKRALEESTKRESQPKKLKCRDKGDSFGRLILLRHGRSIWNRDPKQPAREWKYAGTVNVPLSTHGVHEALEAGIRMQNIPIDHVFTSTLVRASQTAFLALSRHSDSTPVKWYRDAKQGIADSWNDLDDHACLPVVCSPLLSERCFGELQGVSSTFHINGERTKDYLKKVRNEFDAPFPGVYVHPTTKKTSKGESSKDVYDRAIPFFKQEILPLLKTGRNVLVVAHGFVNRVFSKYLEKMSDEEWYEHMLLEKTAPSKCRLLAPTGAPLIYTLAADGETFERLDSLDKEYEINQSAAAY